MNSPAKDNKTSAERKLVSGSFWLGAAQLVVSLGTLASGLLAARLLSKRDIGLMGIALLALSVLEQLSQSGFDKALVQREKDASAYLNVGFSWNLFRGLALGGVLLALAYPLSLFYKEPLIFPLVAVMALAVVIRGTQNVGTLFFNRRLDFKKLFLIRTIEAFVAVGFSIAAILILRNVWALAIGQLAGALSFTITSYVAHPYRPKLEWDLPKLRELLQYGKWITLTNAAVFLVTQGDDLFVSVYLGPVALAVYQLGYQIANLPTTHVSHVISASSFASFARMQAEPKRLTEAFVNVMKAVMLFAGPVGALIAVMVPYFVAHIIGPKWEPVIPIVQLLVLGGLIRSFLALAGPVFQAVGRTELDFRMQLPRVFVIVVLVWPACSVGGLLGVCLVVILSLLACVPGWFRGINSVLSLGAGRVARENRLAVLSTAILGGTFLVLRAWLGPGLIAMFTVLVLGLVLWAAGLWLLGKVGA